MKKELGTGCFKTYNSIGDTDYSYGYVLTHNTYDGMMIGNPKMATEMEETFINQAKEKINKLNPYTNCQVIKSYQEEYPEVLNTRVLMASVKQSYYDMNIVWFDNGQTSIEESLENILSDVDFSLLKEIDY